MILAISSSGRDASNSTILLEKVVEALPPSLEVLKRPLARMDFRGCMGCGACRAGAPGCVQKDELTPLLDELKEAEAVLLAGPIYYGYPSGILKAFLDRLYCMKDRERRLRMPSGRRLVYILTQGHPDPAAYGEVFKDLDRIFGGYGFIPHRLIAAGVEKPGAARERPDLLAAAAGLASRLTEAKLSSTP